MVMRVLLSKAVLNTKTTARIFPFNGVVDTSDLAGAAFQTTSKFHHHLSLFVKGIEVCRTGIDTKTFFTVLANFLIQRDVGLFVIFKGIESQLLSNLHQ